MMRGCVCRWCGEDVTRADERYEAMDGRAVHAECMEEFLLETVGLEVLDAIQEELKQKGFLAKLQDYEPVDFWGDNEDEAKV